MILLSNKMCYNAPFICNHCPPPPPPTGNSRNDFSSIKALHCRDLLRVIAPLFIIVTSTGYICVISQARHLPGAAGELERSLPRTLAPLSPAHPRRLWGGGAVVTNDWCIRTTRSLGGGAVVTNEWCIRTTRSLGGQSQVTNDWCIRTTRSLAGGGGSSGYKWLVHKNYKKPFVAQN